MAQLIHITVSPWSERARWALDHHRLPYSKHEYTPMISEPRVRLKLKRLGGRLTVPILIDDDVVLRDSFAIARHADVRGSAPPLFPSGREAEIAALNTRLEPAMEAARAITVRRTAGHPTARLEALPVPGWVRPAIGPLADLGVRYFVRKYDVGGRTDADDLGTLRDALVHLRATIDGRPTIYDELSYADILAATLLQGVRPVERRWIPLSPANVECWTRDELADEFSDLLAWRDALYDAYR